ncbi:DUF4012 domain-containing protein [Pseudarthrobacter scleromae]
MVKRGSALGEPSSRQILEQEDRNRNRRRWKSARAVMAMLAVLAVLTLGTLWLGARALTIKTELTAAEALVGPLKESLSKNDVAGAADAVHDIRTRTQAAKEAANDPLWSLAVSLPWAGRNFSAIAEISRSADDVADLGLAPLLGAFGSLDWNALVPGKTGTDLAALEAAAPSVSSAAYAVRASSERLSQIDAKQLLPEVAEPLTRARLQLTEVTGTLDGAASAAQVLPAMLGSEGPRNYLLIIQNNAESRSSGGIPGALAILTLDEGKLSLSGQSSASSIGVMNPVVPTDPQQVQIFSGRLGKFMQDVNLTPDFPTAASTAQKMWERKTGQRVDGVISVDPIVLGYVLQSTGPVSLNQPDILSIAGSSLPLELTGANVVQTLLSDVYAAVDEPELQDSYFASVAQEVFSAISLGKGDSTGLLAAISRGAEENRVLVWSALQEEQAVIARYAVSGSVTGPSISPAQFGVYFNDGTGAKMDYYVKRTVQLIKECPMDGYEQTTVRVTSTNSAPTDAATSLPPYVTGDGIFGVPPGSVQTNIVAYGPVQANVEMAKLNGQKTEFAPHLHSSRPVGVLAIRLAPGESKTVEFTFGKIVQHAEPELVVTPTVQDVKDVTLPTEIATCL